MRLVALEKEEVLRLLEAAKRHGPARTPWSCSRSGIDRQIRSQGRLRNVSDSQEQ